MPPIEDRLRLLANDISRVAHRIAELMPKIEDDPEMKIGLLEALTLMRSAATIIALLDFDGEESHKNVEFLDETEMMLSSLERNIIRLDGEITQTPTRLN